MIARRTLGTFALVTAALALGTGGCIAPPTAADRLTDAAYEMNMATRFGRMDVAMSFVGEKARKQFLASHSGWGRGIRISDLEFAGLEMGKKDEAIVLVHVSWQRIDESTLRTTSIKQRWTDMEKGGWVIADEIRVGGEPGLLGEPRDAPLMEASRGAPGGEGENLPPVSDTPGNGDVKAPVHKQSGHFSTVVIPADDEAVD